MQAEVRDALYFWGSLAALLAVAGVVVVTWLAPSAEAQEIDVSSDAEITVTPDDPCFGLTRHGQLIIGDRDGDGAQDYDYTKLFEECNASDDWLGFTLLSWEWVTGGNFSLMLTAVMILVVWAKYRVAIYPLYIGVVMLPISWFVFPAEFLSFAMLLAGVAIGAYIWWIVTRQTE